MKTLTFGAMVVTPDDVSSSLKRNGFCGGLDVNLPKGRQGVGGKWM
jgi:hypothetical protein